MPFFFGFSFLFVYSLGMGVLFLVLGLLVTLAIVRPGTEEPWRTARTEDLVQILDDLVPQNTPAYN